MSQFPQRLRFDLADAFAGHVEIAADFFKSVVLAILLATVRPQKHSELIVSWLRSAFKTVGLHYIPDLKLAR